MERRSWRAPFSAKARRYDTRARGAFRVFLETLLSGRRRAPAFPGVSAPVR
jgi:hypothetical protein